MNVNTKYKTKKCNLYNISNGKMIEVKIGEGFFDEKPFKDLNVVEVYSYVDKPKKTEVLVQEKDKNGNIVEKRRWRNSDTEREIWITEYLVLNEEEIKELNEEELSYKIENI